MKNDPVFPQLADALNPAVMGPLLQAILDPASADSVTCHVGEKRHKPGKSATIVYRLTSQTHGIQQFTGRLCEPGQASQVFAIECEKRPDLLDGALRFLPKPAMLLWAFPYDRKLSQLPTLLNLNLIQKKLSQLGICSPALDQSITCQVLHYLPERSCMIRYKLQTPAADHSNAGLTLYAKTYADAAGAEVFANMQQLNRQFTSGAQALAYDCDTRTLWQSHVPGKTLCWADLITADGAAIIESMGRCVAGLHGCKITTPSTFSDADVLRDLWQTVTLARQTIPALGLRIQQAVSDLTAGLKVDETPVTATIHHDLKLNNFLLDLNVVGLIDMDCVCCGDPAADLGSLIANLYLNGLRAAADVVVIDGLVNRLVASYSAHNAHGLNVSHLRWHVAAALIHEVCRRSLRQLDEQRIAAMPAYLDVSARYAALSQQTGSANNAFV